MCLVVLRYQGTQQHGEAGAHDELVGTKTRIRPERLVGRPEGRVVGCLEEARNTAAEGCSKARVGRDEDQAMWPERMTGRL